MEKSGKKGSPAAGESLNALSLVCKLMMMYQPGGIAERGAILRNLEQPLEANNIQAAVTGIRRRWLRWKRRAEEIGVSLPDPSVLNRGLHRLVRKVLEGNRDLSFRNRGVPREDEQEPEEETDGSAAHQLRRTVEPWGETMSRSMSSTGGGPSAGGGLSRRSSTGSGTASGPSAGSGTASGPSVGGGTFGGPYTGGASSSQRASTGGGTSRGPCTGGGASQALPMNAKERGKEGTSARRWLEPEPGEPVGVV